MHWLITSRSRDLATYILVFALVISIFPLLKAETIFREFDTREPFVVDNPSNYTYVTSYGNYSFDKTTGAYQYAYRNGTILAPSVKFILQYLDNKSSWEDLPLAPAQFVEVLPSHLQWNQRVQRSPYSGYIVVDAFFYADRPPKLGVVYDKPISLNLTFRFLFKVTIPQAWIYFLDENEEISIIPQSDSLSLRRNKVRVLETPNSVLRLLVDWSDFGSTTVLLKGSTVTVVFPDNINDIDPTVIGECSIYTNRFQFQRKLFNALNRDWIWFYVGSYIKYATSSDGSNWDVYSVRNATDDMKFSVWDNETHVSYAYARAYSEKALYYRCGKLNTDGTISWLTSEQTVLDPTPDVCYKKPFISVDSNNYPWISYARYDESSIKTYPYVVKSKFNNGTWSHADGFPYQISTVNSVTWGTVVIPLSSTKMYSVYLKNSIFGKLWNGTGWESEETISSSTTWDTIGWGVVADESDNIFYVGLKDFKNIIALKRTYGTGWGTEETVKPDLYADSYPVISLGNDEVFCFWSDSKHVYFKRRTDQDGWDQSAYDWIDESDTYLSADALASCYKMKKGNIGICYWKGFSPYLTFAKIGFSASTWVFNIYNTSFDYPIEDPIWDEDNRKLSFYAYGNVTIDLGTFNENPLSISENDKSLGWTKTGSNITLTNLSGGKILVSFETSTQSSSSTTTEPTDDGKTAPISPPFSIDKLGLIAIVGGVGVFTFSALYGRLTTSKSRSKPRGIRSRGRPPPKVRSRPKRTVKVPRKPQRSKKTGRFIK